MNGEMEMEARKVLKPFSTPTRRFAEGAEVVPADIDGPLTFEAWVELGHIAASKAKAGKKADAA